MEELTELLIELLIELVTVVGLSENSELFILMKF